MHLEYAVTFWKSQHNIDLDNKAVTAAITSKLLSEHTEQLKEDARLAAAKLKEQEAATAEAERRRMNFNDDEDSSGCA